MRRMLLVTLLAGLPAASTAQPSTTEASAEPPFAPPAYVAYAAGGPIDVNGRLDEATWAAAPWTDDFVDIEGGGAPRPRLRTRAKILWDDEALYVAARLEEPDVWATLTEREARIYLDNAFEVFVDPDGDTHHYFELEVNALGTVWDLMLARPYRDGGPAFTAWDIRGLRVGVHVDGTLNDPTNRDAGWTVELALPWAVLGEAATGRRPPRDGEQWRLNLARAQWPVEVVDGAYAKPSGPASGRPEADWWVWAPPGSVDMHKPERWGYVQFAETLAGEGTVPFVMDPNERLKWALRRLYYCQRAYRASHGRYAVHLEATGCGAVSADGVPFEPRLQTTRSTYEITSPGVHGRTVHIRHDGRVWTTAR